ncbi:MAG TPA: alpha/beta hydrolase [Vicinamibacteria bacterium]|nr:alpha/beta hydrolase [Vicinamibacteria bacterium]
MTEAEKPGLILVPGLDGTALLFYRQIPPLSSRFRVASFRLPDDSSCTMEDLVSELDARVDELVDGDREERVILCGESFGGALSLSYALSHPQRLRGLVILNSFAWIRRRILLRLGPIVLKALPWGTMSIARRFTESRLHTAHTSQEDLKEFRERSHAIGRAGYLRRLEILWDYDLRDRVSEIATPALFLAADQDRLVDSVEQASYMSAHMPNATMRVLEGYGHICMINHDFHLLDHIEPWLRSISPVLAQVTDE